MRKDGGAIAALPPDLFRRPDATTAPSGKGQPAAQFLSQFFDHSFGIYKYIIAVKIRRLAQGRLLGDHTTLESNPGRSIARPSIRRYLAQ
jgi:hypothetical protein